jgi:hypothetical protein
VCIRKLGALKVRSEVIINSLMVAGFVTSIPALAFGPSPVIPSSWDQYTMLVGIGLCGYLGQIALTRGLLLEKAAPASAMRFLDIPCVFLWEVTLLGGTVNAWSIGGAALILVVLTANLVRKCFKRPEPETGTRPIARKTVRVRFEAAAELVGLRVGGRRSVVDDGLDTPPMSSDETDDRTLELDMAWPAPIMMETTVDHSGGVECARDESGSDDGGDEEATIRLGLIRGGPF